MRAKHFISTAVTAMASAILLSGPAAAQTHEAHAPDRTIVETAVEAGTFETLVAAVQAAGLVEALMGDGPFTVFAPTDEAFARLPEGTVEDLLRPENREKLQAILLYHVVPARLVASEVVQLETVESASGRNLSIEVADGAVRVGGARVLQADVVASNGVIHAVDRVLLPPTE